MPLTKTDNPGDQKPKRTNAVERLRRRRAALIAARSAAGVATAAVAVAVALVGRHAAKANAHGSAHAVVRRCTISS